MECSSGAPASGVTREIKICRLCFGRTPVVFSLLDAKIGEILEAVAAIQVSFEDPVSPECCVKCLLNLKLAYRIRQGMIAASKRMLEETSFASVKLECGSAGDLLETDSLCEDSNGGSLIPALSEQGQGVRKAEGTLLKCCPICLTIFKDLRSYSSHFRECSLLKSNVHISKNYSTEAKNSKQRDDEQICEAEEPLPKCCQICLRVFKDLRSYDSHFVECSLQKSKVQVGENRTEAKQQSSSNNRKTLIIKWIETEREPTESAPIVATEDGRYQCVNCLKQYPTRPLCWSHWSNTHKLKPCPVCKKVYSSNYMFRHMDTHSEDAPKVCDLCGKTFKNKGCLWSHKFYYHNKFRYNCEQCGRVFMKKIDLSIHVNKEHSDNPTLYICESCGKKFEDSYLLRDHIVRMHERKKDFICKYCDKNFSSHSSLRTHTRQHTNEAPYRCKMCGESFRQGVSLKSHLKSKHGVQEKKDVPCEVCGKAFATKRAVKAHMRLHNL